MRVHLFLPAAVIIAPRGQIEIINVNCDLGSEPANKFAFTSLHCLCNNESSWSGLLPVTKAVAGRRGVSSHSVGTPSSCSVRLLLLHFNNTSNYTSPAV